MGGHSAGGHLAALDGAATRLAHQQGVTCNAIKALFSNQRLYDIGEIPQDRVAFLAPDARSDTGESAALSRDNRMPFLLAVGAQDFPVLYAQAYTMTAALRDTEGP